MKFSATDRKKIKAEQKRIVKAHLGRCVGITALYLLPILLISIIGIAICAGSMITGGQMNPIDMSTNMSTLGSVMLIMFLVMIIVCGPLALGLMNFYLALSRGEEPGVSELFHPFTSLHTVWRGIKMMFCLELRALLWMIVPLIAYTAGVFAIAGGSNAAADGSMGSVAPYIAGIVVLYIVFLVVIFLLSVKVAMYNAGYVLLHEDEEIGAWAATRDGAAVFKGNFKNLLVFFLSFLPWILLYLAVYIPCVMLISLGGVTGAIVGTIILIAFLIVYLAFLSAYQNMAFLALCDFLMGRGAQETVLPDNGFGAGYENNAPEAPNSEENQ